MRPGLMESYIVEPLLFNIMEGQDNGRFSPCVINRSTF